MADQWTPKWPGKHVGSLDVARKLRDRLPAGTSNGDLLVWEDPPGRWVAGAPVAGSLNELVDVAISGPQTGDQLTYDAATGLWTNLSSVPAVLGAWERAANDTKPPGAGNWSQNKGSLGEVDEVYISETDADATDRTTELAGLGAGDTLVLTVSGGARGGNTVTFLISDTPTDEGAYRLFKVTNGAQTGDYDIGDRVDLRGF